MKMKFYYIYFIICLIEILNAVVVENGNDIINYFSKSKENIFLNINSEIDITEEIKINVSIKKISFVGNSLVSAKLNLKYPLRFDSNIEEIEIKDINIDGKLFFKKKKIKKVIFNSVNLNGYIDFDFDNNSNNVIELTYLTYKPTGELVENCINLSGNLKINKSNFYGNSSCRNRLLHFNGYDKYSLDLKESKFYGKYECPFLSIEYTSNANIETSYFEKGYSSKNIDGGYIKKKRKLFY